MTTTFARDSNPARELFLRHFGHTPAHAVRVPGRVQLLGGAADSHHGLSLSAAIDRCVDLCASPRLDGQVELVCDTSPDPHRFWISNLIHDPRAPWADPVKGVMAHLRRRGVHFNGFNAAIWNSTPPGIHRTAPVAVATGLMLRKLHPYSLTELGAGVPPPRDSRGRLPSMPQAERLHLARICQASQTGFDGVDCGLVETLAPLVARAHHLMVHDGRFQTVDHALLPGVALVICGAGVPADAQIGSLDSIRQEWETAAQALRTQSLRSVDTAFLKANRGLLNHRQYACVHYLVGETQRVVFAERALRSQDPAQLGQYLIQSHECSKDLLGSPVPEVDVLMDLARNLPGFLGARGFGGATLNLVDYHQAEAFMQTVAAEYHQHTGLQTHPFVCQMIESPA